MELRLKRLPVEEQVRQLLWIGLPGTDPEENARLVEELRPGGIIYFQRNVESRDQLAALSARLQEASPVPLLISIDHEGGRVDRLRSAGFTHFPPALELGRQPVYRRARAARSMARELHSAGIHLNLAPSADVWTNPRNTVIADRAWGRTARAASENVALWVEVHQGHDVGCVAKHFPGHGMTTRDSHLDLPLCRLGRPSLERDHLAPFRACIEAGVTGIMMAHVVYPALDPERRPATFSPPVYRLLRGELGFEGLVFTDDMEMGAISNHWGVETAAVEAVLAGADAVFVCHHPELQRTTLQALMTAAEDGRLTRERLGQSMERMQRVKER